MDIRWSVGTLVLLGACRGVTYDIYNQSEFHGPSSLTISSDRPLEIVRLKSTTGLATTNSGGYATSGSGLTYTALGTSASGSGSASSPIYLSPDTTGQDAGTSTLSEEDGTQEFTASISVSSEFSSKTNSPLCRVYSPFASLSCRLTGFTLASTLFTAYTSLQIQGYDSSYARESKDSNVLEVTPWEINLHSNTSNDEGFDDNPTLMTSFDDALFFVALNEFGVKKLYRYGNNQVIQISDTRSDPSTSDDPQNLIVYNSFLYFTALNDQGVQKLFRTEGGSVETFSNLRSNAATSDGVGELTIFNSRLYFTGTNSGGKTKLFWTDGSTIYQDTDTSAAGTNDAPASLTVFGSELYFAAKNSNGVLKVHKTNGSQTVVVSDTAGGSNNDDDPKSFTTTDSCLYFMSNDSGGHQKLHQKCASATVFQVSDLASPATASDNITSLKGVGSNVYFNYNDLGIYKLADGNSLKSITRISKHTPSSAISLLNGVIYWVEENSLGSTKIFKYDGSNLEQISNTRGDENLDDDPESLYVWNSALYFVAKDTAGLLKLYKYDGTRVTKLSDFFSGSNDFTSGVSFGTHDGVLYFAGQTLIDGARKLMSLSVTR